MDLRALADLAQQYGGGAEHEGGHRPGLEARGGRRPGLQVAAGCAGRRRAAVPLRHKSRGALLRLLGPKQKRQAEAAKAFQSLARHANRTGRNRTADYNVPGSGVCKGVCKTGKGKWKTWTPDAVLRSAFASEGMAVRHVASQVDGSGHRHAAECKHFAAQLVMAGQKDGLAQFLAQAAHEAPRGDHVFDFALTTFMFDETELEVNLYELGLGAWSVLASHAQVSFRLNGHTHDFDMIRAPVAIANKQAVTMFPALCAGSGGLWPGLSTISSKIRAVLVTCDAAPANVRLLNHLLSVQDPRTFLLPLKCVQHRAGNVIERVTKFFSVLTGAYAVSKTLRSGHVIRRLTHHVRDVLASQLVVIDQVPDGVEEEWASGRVWAKQILDLVKHGGEVDQAKADAPTRFLEFFAGPWTGQFLGAQLRV